ncbi:MAG TPA: CocE/NonD family hydrolase, partial [Acidimicrobiales bacterium]|nr:CocE/NonD family hydrolase [Acidimicrobiales bacterium]
MTPERYGIVVSKDVMIPMRDGIRLASDIYRPAAEGEPVEGRYPTIVCRTPYDKTDKRYIEIADFFVPHGYAVVLQDLRDRYRSEGTGDYFHSAAPHNGPDGYDTIEWIATQPFSDGRTGMVGSSYAGITAITAALENPPHLTAIWPDVAPTNNYENQAREGGVMQLHMFWALFIHAQDAQDIAGEPVKQAEVWADFRKLRENLWATPWRKGQFSLRHCPALDQTLEDYVTRGAYDEFWAAKTNDYTRYWDDHGDIPVTISEGWFDPFCGAGGEYYATMAARNRAPQHLVIGPWSHVGMRGGATFTLDVDFGEHSRWGVERYFDEQLAFFDRFLRPERAAEASQVAPVRLFVMGGGSGRRTAAGKLDHGGRWRDEQEWPLSRARTLEWFLHADGSLRLEAPTEGNAERRFTYDPAHPVPTVGGLYVAIGELPPGEPEMEPMWARLLSPVLRLRNL